jgi:hypothetical protein
MKVNRRTELNGASQKISRRFELLPNSCRVRRAAKQAMLPGSVKITPHTVDFILSVCSLQTAQRIKIINKLSTNIYKVVT